MTSGSPWSETFLRQLSEKDVRDEFVADQMRARIAQLIRILREQPDRRWTQAQLAERAGTSQNVISRFEDPDYGKMSLQSLFEIAAAFDLPVWVDFPEWKDWLAAVKDFPTRDTQRGAFDLKKITQQSQETELLAPGTAAASAAFAIKQMLSDQSQVGTQGQMPLNENIANQSLSRQRPIDLSEQVANSPPLRGFAA